MKKIISILLLCISMFFISDISGFCAVDKKINANIKTKRVPSGTVLSLKILDSASSNISMKGDQFDLMVTENIKVDNTIVIPQGTIIRGSVENVEPSKILYKGGTIRLYFDHIVSSTGKQVPFYAGICNNLNVTYDGALSTHTTYSDAFSQTVEDSVDIITKSTSWAWDKGDELLNGTPKYIMAPLTAIFSTPIAGIYFLGDTVADIFKKGKNITLNQGEILQVQLLKPLDMPVY